MSADLASGLVAETGDTFDVDRIAAVSSALDLRQPNREALESIVFETVQHFEIDKKPPPFEAVVDVATGVGKTFVLAGAIEYFAGTGTRNFAVITPGRTILDKTVANFTPGSRKSLLGGMSVEPVVITSDNFASAAMRAAMDDDQQVKLYIFTVQSLLKPETKAGSKAHKFQEGLGQAFYARLQTAPDLMVFADEHHAYYGKAFSTAVRELHPNVLIGLTATPHRQTPDEQIIYRYPLAAAIADRYVKTPVLVGRKDDRTDPTTKLSDGVALLELKEQAGERYAAENDLTAPKPLMLVVAANIAEAEEVEIIKDPSFFEGRYADKVLTVHSSAPDEALAALDRLEEPANPYRIVVSVAMLKEGWDVKGVAVICSLRASVSALLTEQTLGRGLRLLFGGYTDIEILDSLEVLAHERYEQLLKKAGVLNEEFVDRRTRAVLRKNAEGQLVSQVQTTEVTAPVAVADDDATAPQPVVGQGQAVVASVEDHQAKGEEELKSLVVELPPRSELPTLRIPQLKMSAVKSQFSLADITETDAFRKLGERLAADPEGELRRTTISARVVEGRDGLRRTELVTAPAIDRVISPARLFPLEGLRERLLDPLLSSPVVPARANQRAAAGQLIEAFITGLGDQAQDLLSGYLDRAIAGLIAVVAEEQRRYAAKPSYEEVVKVSDFGPTRHGKPEFSTDREGAFKRGVAYEYARSLYTEDWFDSAPERTVANMVEQADEVRFWVRLQRHDLPILWAEGRNYEPDFIVVEQDDTHWVVEAKQDKEMPTDAVKGKREAAKRWANHCSTDPQVGVQWRYLLVSETDVDTSKGSWPALKKLGA